MTLSFKNKVALVTGGSRGIGKQIAMDLNRLGARVFITSSSIPDWDYKKLGITHVKIDFNDIEETNMFIQTTLKIIKFDILINNAGINIIKNIDDVSMNDYDRISNINLKVPYMISKDINIKNGKIVNIASIWSIKTKPMRTLYTTMKNGIVGMTKSFSAELAPNVLVNSVSPGFTNTELTEQSLTEEEKNNLSEQIPMKRFAETEEISKLVLFLCSDLNTYITGQNIIIDGGFTNV